MTINIESTDDLAAFIAACREHDATATRAPWRDEARFDGSHEVLGQSRAITGWGRVTQSSEDAALIAFARNSLPSIIAIAEELQRVRAELREALWQAGVARLERVTAELERDTAKAEAAKLRDALEAVSEAMGDYFAEYGAEHVETDDGSGDMQECPQDDTCRCPLLLAVDAAFAKADAALTPTTGDGR